MMMALLPLLMCCVALQGNAQIRLAKAAPNRVGSVYDYLPNGYQQVGTTNTYWANASTSYLSYWQTLDVLGGFGEYYYSSTYNNSGYLPAFKVNDNEAVYLDCLDGTVDHGVEGTASIVPYGELARMVYTMKNTTDEPVTVSVGVWADVCIGYNDYAAIERRVDPNGNVYGLTMKFSSDEGAPAFAAIFGVDLAGVTIADDFWFGEYYQNNYAYQIVGDYSHGSNWMQENGSYDSGMGWCWKNREIQPGESMEFAFLLGVGDVNFSYAEFEVVPTNLEVWNDLSEIHTFNVNGTYVSPLGHNGAMFVQVDDSEEWVEIPGTVLSGGNFSLPFGVMFTQGLATHELRFRIVDEVGNITELGSVSWPDVAAYPVSGAFGDLVYNGMEQTYNDLTYDMDPTHWVTYYKDNIYPGTGYFVTEGLYPYSIGYAEYPFNIDKAACVWEVVLPDAMIDYDGAPHGATVIVPSGSGLVAVTYVNTATGAVSGNMPVQPGIYDIYVQIGEGDYYYGIENTFVGSFEIVGDPSGVDEIVVNNNTEVVIYNMQGARVQSLQPGLYIVNGKKVLVK